MSPRLAKLAASAAALALLAAPVAASAGSPTEPSAAFSAPVAIPDTAAAQGWPQQNVLPVWPDNPNDASIGIGVMPYDEIAPKLNALQAQSNRVSARVAGKSSGNYDLYVVTVTAPETAAESAQQEAWKNMIQDEPVRASNDAALLENFKPTLYVHASIHGNEYEGVDAAMRVIEQWATSTDPAV